MKTFVVLTVISCAFAAPTKEFKDQGTLERTKKSPSLAASPYSCGGGPSLAPVALYLSASPQQHYREDDAEFAQHDHALFEHHHHFEQPEHARSYYEPAPAASIPGLAGLAPAGPIVAPAGAIGPILGPAPAPISSALFPVKPSNCAVPLLLSCAPSVVQGHLSHGYAHGYGAALAPAYKTQQEQMKEAMEKAASEQSFQVTTLPQKKAWSENARTSLDEPKLTKAQFEAKSRAKEAAILPPPTHQPQSIIDAKADLTSVL